MYSRHDELDVQLKLITLEKAKETLVSKKFVSKQFNEFYGMLKNELFDLLYIVANEIANSNSKDFDSVLKILLGKFTQFFSSIETESGTDSETDKGDET